MTSKSFRSARLFPCGFAAVFAILLGGSPAQAQTYYWDTSAGTMVGGSGTWDPSTSQTWSLSTTGDSPLLTWTANSNAEFSTASGTVAVNGSPSVNNITFDPGTNYTLSGGTLLLSGAISANANATIASAIGGSVGLTVSGYATLTLAGTDSNYYSGNTAVIATGSFPGNQNQLYLVLSKSGGAIAIPGNLSLGSTSYGGEVVMEQPNQFGPSSVLTFVAGGQPYERFSVSGNNQILAGVIDNSGGNSILQNGANLLGGVGPNNAVVTFNLSTSNNTLSGYVRDNDNGSNHTTTLGITVEGSGMLTLSGNHVAYTGPTTVTGGTLVVNNCASFASSSAVSGGVLLVQATSNFSKPITVSGGTLVVDNCANFASPVTNNSVFQLGGTSEQNWTMTQAISGSGTVLENFPNFQRTMDVVTLAGALANTDTGVTSVQGGTLVLSKTGAVAVAGNISVGGSPVPAEVVTEQPNQFAPNTVVTFAGGNYDRLSLSGNNQTFAGVIDNSTGNSILQDMSNLLNPTTAPSATATFNLSTTNNSLKGYVRDNDNGTHVGTLGITVQGSGMLTLKGGNVNYTGPTTITGGTLVIDGCANFASPVTNNSVLQLGGTSGNPVATSQAISGSGAVFVAFPGQTDVATMAGTAANSDTGTTTLLGGTLVLSKTGVVAVAGNLSIGGGSAPAEVATEQPNQFAANTVVTFNPSALAYDRLSLSGNNQTFAGAIDNSAGISILQDMSDIYNGTTVPSATATFNLNTTNNTLGGYVRDADNGSHIQGTLGVTVQGSGMLTISGAHVNYTGATTISGGTLALSNCTAFASAVTDNSVLQLDQPGGNWTMGQPIGGSGSLLKTGSGLVFLSVSNSYSGGTTIDAGTLQLGAALALGSANASLAVNNPGVLDLHGYNVSASSLSGGGTINNTAAGAYTLTVGVGDASSTFSGAIQNTAGQISLTKTGAGALALTGNNTYSGTTTVAGGTLQLVNFSDINTPTTVSNATLLANINNNSPGSPGFFFLSNLSGNTTVVLSGTGVATLRGNPTVALNPGQLIDVEPGVLLSNDQLGVNWSNNKGSLYIASGGTFDIRGQNTTVDALNGGGTIGNDFSSGTNVLTVGINNGSGTFSGTIHGSNSGLPTSPSNPTPSNPYNPDCGTTALTKAGNGVEVLSGSNTYTGATTISGGTLQIGNGTSGEYLASPSVAVSNNATLAFSHSDTLTYSGAISGSGQVTEQGGGMLILSGSNSYTGPTTVNGGTLQVGDGGAGEAMASNITMNNATVAFSTLSYNATISGTGQFVKVGTGSLDLSGTNTYSGATTISAGTLALDGGGENLPTATALTIASSGVLDMDGVPQTVGSLSGSAGAVVGNSQPAYPATLTVASSAGSATTFAGNIISNNALAFTGSGELTLSGTNTYSGGTTVSGGTLDIAAPSALSGSGLVTIAAGGRLVLGSGEGIGALLAASSPAGSGAVALSAAASAPGTLGGYENTCGNMATLGGAPPLSQGGGGSAVGGTAAAVPEPATLALLAAGAVAAAAVRRKRKGC